MSDSLKNIPRTTQANHRHSVTPNRSLRYVSTFLLLAALSTAAGFQAARCEFSAPRWFHGSTLLTFAAEPSHALIPASDPGTGNADFEAISHMAPQQQAERLLKLALDRPDQSLGLIHKNLDSWRGHLADTDRLFHLVLAALDSNDPRVRVAAVEIDLVANNLRKSPQSLARLLHQIHDDPGGRNESKKYEGETMLAKSLHSGPDLISLRADSEGGGYFSTDCQYASVSCQKSVVAVP